MKLKGIITKITAGRGTWKGHHFLVVEEEDFYEKKKQTKFQIFKVISFIFYAAGIGYLFVPSGLIKNQIIALGLFPIMLIIGAIFTFLSTPKVGTWKQTQFVCDNIGILKVGDEVEVSTSIILAGHEIPKEKQKKPKQEKPLLDELDDDDIDDGEADDEEVTDGGN